LDRCQSVDGVNEVLELSVAGRDNFRCVALRIGEPSRKRLFHATEAQMGEGLPGGDADQPPPHVLGLLNLRETFPRDDTGLLDGVVCSERAANDSGCCTAHRGTVPIHEGPECGPVAIDGASEQIFVSRYQREMQVQEGGCG
jgi:hypothetical protein